MEECLGSALAYDAGIVGALVVVFEPWQHVAGLMHGVGELLAELIGYGEQQRDECALVRRLDLEYVETDALRGRRIVQQTIALGLLQRRGNSFAGDRFQLHRAPPWAAPAPFDAALLLFPSRVDLHELANRVEELVDDALLQRDDGVVGNRDVFRTDLRAALGDVAVADT